MSDWYNTVSDYIKKSIHPGGTQAVQAHFGEVQAPTTTPIGSGMAKQAQQTVQNRGSQLDQQIRDAGG